MRRRLHPATVSPLQTAPRQNGAAEVRVIIRPQYRRAALAPRLRRHVNHRSFVHHHLRRMPDAAVLTLPAATHIHFTAAGLTRRRYQAPARQVDILSLQRDFTPAAAVAVCQQHPRLAHHTAVTAVQYDFSPALAQPLRFHRPAVIHHRVQQHVLPARRQVHLTVRRRD